MEDIEQLLKDYVATANSGKYEDWEVINSKFPELGGYDSQILKDYVATANSGKYEDWSQINEKFPELFPEVPKGDETKESGESVSALGDTESLSDSNQIDLSIEDKDNAARNIQLMYEKVGIDDYNISDEEITKEALRMKDETRLKSLASDIDKVNKENDPKKQRSYFSNLVDNLEQGSTELGKMIASVPETLYDVFSIPQNLFSKATGIDIEASSSKFKEEHNIDNPILDFYVEESEKLGEKISEFNAENYESSSIYENIKLGNYGDAFELLGSGIANSAPISVGMMAGGAATSTAKLAGYGTLAFTGSKRLDVERENPELAELDKTIKALGLAGAETVFSAISTGGMGRVYKDMILKEGKEQGAVLFKQGLVKMYETAFRKYGGTVGALGEGIEEVATTMTQNMIEGRPIMENVPDSFIQGVGGGAMYGAPVNIKNAVTKIEDGFNTRQINKIIEAETNDYTDIVDAFVPESEITADKVELVQKKGAYKRLEKQLNKEVEEGILSEEAAEASKKEFLDTELTVSKTKGVNLSKEGRVEAVSLIREKEQLKSEIKTMDDALASTKKERVLAIDERLINLATEGKGTPKTEKVTAVKGDVVETTPEQYAASMSEAMEAMKKEGKGLDLQVDLLTEEDAKKIVEEGGKLFMTKDGKSGAYVKADGYMGGLFKNPESELKNVSKVLQEARLEAGGKYFDAYATELESIYIKNGFKPVARVKFDESMAPKGWDAETSPLKDRPDLVFFKYDPKSKNKKGEGEYFDSYKDAQKTTLEAITKSDTQVKEKVEQPETGDTSKQQIEEGSETPPMDKEIKEKSKTVADNIRKYKINSDIKKTMSKLNTRPTAPFEVAWDGAIEIVASTVELTGNLAQAIHDGIENLRSSEWYRGLSKEGRQKAERMFKEDLNRQFKDEDNQKEGIVETIKASKDKLIEVVTQRFIDKYYILRKEIKKKFNIKDEAEDFSTAEILMHGKAANDLDKFDKELEPLIKEVKAKGFSMDEISDYMYAKHAEERNKHIKENVDSENEFGSGMTPQEADRILNRTFTEDQIKDLEELSDKFQDIIKGTRDLMLESGLITREQYNSFEDYYENYVPLRGFENQDIESSDNLVGSSLDVSGKVSKRAAGRSTRADNVIANIISQRSEVIIKARKNEVLQTLYNLAKKNPDNDVMTLYSKDNLPKQTVIQEDGTKVRQPERPEQRDDYVGVKVNGEQYYLKFANKRLGKILNSANIEKTDVITKTLGRLNRYLSATLTTLNPEFVISNFARDIQTAVINVAAESDINKELKGQKIASKVVKDVTKSIKAIYGNERKGKKDKEFEKYYEEFKEDGAKTGWANQYALKDIKKKLESIHKLQDAKTLSASNLKSKTKALYDFVNDVNTAVENGVRLSAYVNARKAGVSRSAAAKMAKELTVNFNQSGEWGTLANSLYLFFNAAIQGNVRFIKAMTTLKKTVTTDEEGNVKVKKSLNRGQKIALGLVAFSSTMAMLNQAISDDDEDGKSFYSKIPDYEKERNLIFMNPANGKDYFKIPLPYGYNIFHNIGTIAAEVSSGERGVGDGVGFLTSSIVGAFSPVSLGQSESLSGTLKNVLSPTMLKPVFDLHANEDYFGSQIYNEDLPFNVPTPAAERGRKTTPEAFKNMAKFLNEVSGGDAYESGELDYAPESLYYLFKFGVGGTGNFVHNTIKGVGDIMEGEDLEARETPFLRKVYGEPNKYVDQSMYFDRHDMIRQREESLKAKIKDRTATPEERRTLPKVSATVKSFKKITKELSDIREKKKKVEKTINRPEIKKKKLKELDERYYKKIKRANAIFNDKLGKNYK